MAEICLKWLTTAVAKCSIGCRKSVGGFCDTEFILPGIVHGVEPFEEAEPIDEVETSTAEGADTIHNEKDCVRPSAEDAIQLPTWSHLAHKLRQVINETYRPRPDLSVLGKLVRFLSGHLNNEDHQ